MTLIANPALSADYNAVVAQVQLMLAAGQTVVPTTSTQPVFQLLSDTGRIVRLPIAPSTYSLDGLAGGWETIARDGRPNLLLPKAKDSATLVFQLTVALGDMQAPVEDYLWALRAAAESNERFTLSGLGGQVRGLWRITTFKITPTQLQEQTNLVCRATVDLTLTDAGPVLNVSPVTGGLGVAPPPPPPAPAAPPASRTYTVVSGDCLWNIAIRYYGAPLPYWQQIADRNGVRDPRLLQIGTVLVIP